MEFFAKIEEVGAEKESLAKRLEEEVKLYILMRIEVT